MAAEDKVTPFAHRDYADENIETSAPEAYGIEANNGDTATATNVNVSTHGGEAHGVVASGAGSQIDYNGGTIATQGQNAYGILASDGAKVNIDGTYLSSQSIYADLVVAEAGGDISVRNSTLEVFGSDTHAVASAGNVVLTDTDIVTHATYARGLFANTDGSITGTRVNITTEGERSHGVHMGTGRVELTDSSITTSGAGAYGVVNIAGDAVLRNTTVKTAGDNGTGLLANAGGAAIAMNGGSVETSGLQGDGVHAQNGGRIDLVDTDVRTRGNVAQAIHATGGGTVVASGVDVLTSGTNSRGLYADGANSVIGFAGGTISTNNANSDGVYIANGGSVILGRDVNGVGSVIDVGGAAVGVLIGYGSATGSGSLNADGATITAQKGAGIYAQGSGSTAVVSDSVITGKTGAIALVDGAKATVTGSALSGTADKIGHAIQVSTGSSFMGAGLDVSTSGMGGRGVSARDSGSSASIDSSAIHTTGENGAYALFADTGASVQGSNLQIATTGRTSHGAFALAGGHVSVSGTQIVTAGEIARGLVADGAGSTVTAQDVSIDTSGKQAYGVLVYDGARIDLDRVTIRTTGELGHGFASTAGNGQVTGRGVDIETSGVSSFGLRMESGSSVLLVDSRIRTIGAASRGAMLNAAAGTTTSLSLTNSLVQNTDSRTFEVRGDGDVVIDLVDSQASGDTGILLSNISPDATPGSGHTAFSAAGSSLGGDILFDGVYRADVLLSAGTVWTGATHGLESLGMTDSVWNLTENSSVGALDLNGSMVDFAAPGARDTGYKTLDVLGNLSGTGGAIGLNTLLDAGGALSEQRTDRVLVHGDVTTTGTTLLDVHGQGDGALTDTNRNGIIDADEGISLVQVAGASRADAFGLKGGYVAAGPWQYTLHAFGPGQADQGQNALGTGDLSWDYRLGNAFVTDPGHGGEDPNPGDGDGNGENPAPNPGEETGGGQARPAVIPQLPSYISAPTALLAYGNQTIDTLHQRLGEIRNVTPGAGGEVFARYIGSQQRYSSDLGFKRYGYDFDQQTNALQLGGSLLGWSGDRSSIRAGWALDKGTTRVTPKAADGGSRAKYDANGVSAWLTWQQDNGLYVDAIVGGQRFHGNVSTDLRGSDVGKVRANGWTASVEAGYPITLGQGWAIEPQAQIKRQSLSFRTIDDVDGVSTKIAPVGQTTARLGARITKTDEAKLAPYLRADVIRTVGGRAQVTASNTAWDLSETFVGGRVGTSYRIGAGLSSQLTKNVALYGEANYQKGTGGNGFRGWAGTVGIRFDF